MKTTKKNLQQTVWVKQDEIDKNRARWHIDAADKTLGRLAVEISKRMIGKHKPYYCDMWDCGDYIVVTNVEKMLVTGTKMQDKIYYRHSGHKGHLKEIPLAQLMNRKPERVLELAVKGMLPKNKMRKPRLKRLKIFVGGEHPYTNMTFKSLDLAHTETVEQLEAQQEEK